MGWFWNKRRLNIDEEILRFQKNPGAVLLDVRTQEEYRMGHIPQSVNLPLDNIGEVSLSRDAELCVYCQSGMRSAQACRILKEMGYTHVSDWGGLQTYSGRMER